MSEWTRHISAGFRTTQLKFETVTRNLFSAIKNSQIYFYRRAQSTFKVPFIQNLGNLFSGTCECVAENQRYDLSRPPPPHPLPPAPSRNTKRKLLNFAAKTSHPPNNFDPSIIATTRKATAVTGACRTATITFFLPLTHSASITPPKHL